LSDAQLYAELARRQLAKGPQTLEDIELAAAEGARLAGEELQAANITALPPEDGKPKACPRCKAMVPVKARNRVRMLLTIAGELRLSRNYHYCRACNLGFYPRDLELKLPDEGEVSSAMERRILDFGVNDTFAGAAERWGIHYPMPISSNLVRRVVARVGAHCEAAFSEEHLQRTCLPPLAEPAPALVVAADGSMLLTREDAWRETKVGVIARLGSDRDARHFISAPRYVAVLGGKAEFGVKLAAALAVERADEVSKVAWLADGALSNWTLASELCPFAIQILDIIHAVQHGNDCGKALLGEGDPALPLWEARIRSLIDAPTIEPLMRELMDCLPFTSTEVHLAALDNLLGYYRTNQKRMRYAHFKELGLPIGSGMVESAHRHVLQERMKRAGQRWAVSNARQMVRLRAAYRTTGAKRFHWAIREALHAPKLSRARVVLPNGPRRPQGPIKLHRGSSLNRAELASK
jgi:hypothetical protein